MSTRAEITSALYAISPDCSYDRWYRIAAALYNELGDEGFDLFDAWSAGSQKGKYPSWRGCRRQWDYSKRLTQITIRSLFHFARNMK
jgi:putative DNA primase/helicase